MSTAVSTSSVTSERFTGRVKWFNNKAGYGFITVTDGPKAGSDIFVHHSSIRVDAQQYKYLVQGEYTEFALSTVSNSAHECQAGEVSGIKGGKLMCETRYDTRASRTTYKSSEQDQEQAPVRTVKPRQVLVPRDDAPSAEAPAAEWKPARKPRQQTTGPGPTATQGGRGRETGGRGSTAGRGRGSTAGRGRGSGRGAGHGAGKQ